MKLSLFIRFFSAIFVLMIGQYRAFSQCTNPILSFPYSENFESSNGSWTPGGTASDWSWGTPIKPVINSAASGTKCWITGTLTQSSYSNNQNSTLTSPCFDLSGLSAPSIRFNIFWETEKKYDGASFQYSIDGGMNWNTLGSYADFTACPSDNWFNTNGITVLGTDGWSGNIQPTASCTGGAGGGSGQWKTASHSLSGLAGQSNVRFRFRFGAGSVCNNYDGFAVDDIWIGETPAVNPEFTFTCNTTNTVSFQPVGSSCNTGYTWDFGDPASGSLNTSTQNSPSHTYNSAGQYTVTLTIQNGMPSPPSISKQVTIAEINTSIISPIICFGDRASLLASVTPAGSYTYEWNTLPMQTTSTATGLKGGNYTVKVSGNGVCTATDNITLVEPPALNLFLGNDTVLCSGEQLFLQAGNFDSYQWQNGSQSNSLIVTQSGTYSVTVFDSSGCRATDAINVTIDCSDIYFPSAFTPDNNGRNDQFGALGNTVGISKFNLRIYNRWGQLVFHTTDPGTKWNGNVQDKPSTVQSFAWFSEYTIQATGKQRKQKGTITLVR